MIVFFDIETVSTFSRVVRELGQNSSDSEELLSEKSNFSKIVAKYDFKINFMPEYNKILSIVVGVEFEGKIKTRILCGDEKQMIEDFYGIIEKNEKTILSGFNILNFDIPFIVKRGVFHKISTPESLKFYGKPKWELKHILDLQDVYRMGVFGATGNLDSCCEFFGLISPKQGGIDGSRVQEYYDSGKEEKIHEYCERDVIATAELYKVFRDFNLC